MTQAPNVVPRQRKKAPPRPGAPIAVIRTGAAGMPSLHISTTSNYHWLYDDSGTLGWSDVTLWRPEPSDPSYFILGDYAQGNHSNPTGQSLIVKPVNDDPNNPLIKPPIDFRQIWNDHGSGGWHDGSIWIPVAPDGYISIGFLGRDGYDAPDLTNYACFREDLCEKSVAGNKIWDDDLSGADTDVTLWNIDGVPSAFVAQANYDPFNGTCFKLKMLA